MKSGQVETSETKSKRETLLAASALLREHIPPERSLSEELIAERRVEAEREASDH
jgi:hypothetical protein